MIVEGSSPLTRGKPLDYGCDRHLMGLIPAHAGKTCAFLIVLADGGAHPRSRGENVSGSYPATWQLGSSPLTRGKRFLFVGGDCQAGLIPAHAGKTGLACATTAPLGAHPRSRGENSQLVHALVAASGSSPLTRGKL